MQHRAHEAETTAVPGLSDLGPSFLSFEDFDSSNPGRTIESFIQSVGDIDVLLTVHGPLSLDEIRSVSSYMLSLVRCCSLDKRHCVYNHVWIG